jgi:hypothetical protein
MFHDPDCFFWMLPKLYGQLKTEANDLARKACRIRIPRRSPRKWCVEYRVEHNRFCGFDIVRADSFMNSKWSIRLPYLDFSLPRSYMARDNQGETAATIRMRLRRNLPDGARA